MTITKSYRSILFFIFMITVPSYLAGQERLVFSTWEGFEPDKCASIWLIKRFINKAAVIKFYPKGTIITEGIPFDTPDAKFRRYHNMSTFESILNHYKLQEPKLLHIGKIIHDIEINTWGRKVFDESQTMIDEVLKIITESKNNEDTIQKSLDYFDRLYQKISPEISR